jgi:hypothetical protein
MKFILLEITYVASFINAFVLSFQYLIKYASNGAFLLLNIALVFKASSF